MTAPSLDEIKLYLAGTADAETQARVAEALRDPLSQASRVVAYVERSRRNPLRWSILDLTRIWPWEKQQFPSESIDQAEDAIRGLMARISSGPAEIIAAEWGCYSDAIDLADLRLPPEHPIHRELEELYEQMAARTPGVPPPPRGRWQSYRCEIGPTPRALQHDSDEGDDNQEMA